jgi:hypothetical protein
MLKTFDLINKTSSSSNYGIFIFLGVAATFLILSSIILKYNWNYINQYIKKSSKSELFVNYPGLFLNDEDIKQYVKNVINEISKKDNNNTDNKKE